MTRRWYRQSINAEAAISVSATLVFSQTTPCYMRPSPDMGTSDAVAFMAHGDVVDVVPIESVPPSIQRAFIEELSMAAIPNP